MAFFQVLSVLKLEKGRQMPEDYSKSFIEALAVFQHARMCVDCKTNYSKWFISSSLLSFNFKLLKWSITRCSFSRCIYLWTDPFFFLFGIWRRYDSNSKRLEHMKPVPQNLLESLEGKLDFLGPYPALIERILFLKVLQLLFQLALPCQA